MASAVKNIIAEKIETVNKIEAKAEKKGINKWMLISGISLGVVSVAGGSFYLVRRWLNR